MIGVRVALIKVSLLACVGTFSVDSAPSSALGIGLIIGLEKLLEGPAPGSACGTASSGEPWVEEVEVAAELDR